jgi:diguanylate cyclase (GGDEF)-like protein
VTSVFRFRRPTIGARLGAIVIVPLVALGTLLATGVNEAQQSITRANTLQEITAEAIVLGRLQSLLNLDRGLLQGAAIAREFGFSTEQTRAALGVDLRELHDQVDRLVVATTATLSEFIDGHDHRQSDVDELDSLLQARLSFIDATSNATYDDVSALFERADVILTTHQRQVDGEVQSLLSLGIGTARSTTQVMERLEMGRAFNMFVRSIGRQTYRLGFLVGAPQARESLDTNAPIEIGRTVSEEASALVVLRADTATVMSVLDSSSSLAVRWRSLQLSSLREVGLTTQGSAGLDAVQRARLSSELAQAAIEWLSATNAVYDFLVGELRATTDSLIDETRQETRRQLLIAAAITLGIIAWTFIIATSLTRPLRRLTRRAERLRDGDLTDQPMGAVGARELAALSTTFDQLSANLSLVNHQIETLGAGRINDDVLQRELPGAFGVAMRGSIRQATELTERLAHQAQRDAMTGLPNRAAVLDRLAAALDRSGRSGSQVSLLFIDLDGFKAVNDTYGHGAGDSVLNTVAQRFAEVVRGGEMVARLGGDEFVVVTESADQRDTIVALGQRLIELVEEPIALGDGMFRLSASVGISTANADSTPLSILGQADQAVYEAKRSGRGKVVCFDGEMQAAAEQRREVEQALRHALVAGEFELYIQPIVAARTSAVVAAEALIRWHRPDHGIVMPNDFIKIAEDSWLIVDIGRFVLDEACRLLTLWHNNGLDIALSINVAGRHLADADLVDDVRLALAKHATPAELLSIELTETQLVLDLEHGAAVLTELRKLGVRIALDDFGTGYSSLNYLRQLPIDTMKIDRSYICDLPGDEQSGSIVSSLQQLASSLHLDVVAEGVETAEQARFLADLGCDKLQGYHFARPMPNADFASWASKHQATNGASSV